MRLQGGRCFGTPHLGYLGSRNVDTLFLPEMRSRVILQRVKGDSGVILQEMTGVMTVVRPVLVNSSETLISERD